MILAAEEHGALVVSIVCDMGLFLPWPAGFTVLLSKVHVCRLYKSGTLDEYGYPDGYPLVHTPGSRLNKKNLLGGNSIESILA